MLKPGDPLGRYRIDARLGTGGMGVVYRAQDTVLARPLALKVLHTRTDGDSATRVLREARNASALNHPNICTVYEVGEERGLSFIAMEYVDGPALSARVAEGPLDVEDVVRIGVEIADALAHAHTRGVVHRDLKAANVIVSASGRVKIVDFGLARRMDAALADAATLPTVQIPGTAVGTPYAMAPEQIRGETAGVPADVWALGVLLYECLSGSQPFKGETVAELFASILRDSPAPLPYNKASAPLHEIIATCLVKDPEQRYQDVDEVRLALQEIGPGSYAHAASSRSSRAVASATPLPPPPLLSRSAAATTFVGRDAERAQLAEAWARARRGRRQLVLLAGEPGIGKTHLALDFARNCADQRATVIIGRCDEEALVPYQPFVEALSWYARACPEPDLRRALTAAGGGGELGAFVSDFRTRLPDLPSPTEMNAQGQRYRLFETINALFVAASTSFPVLLFVDDLHWADKPTLSLLRHLVRGSEPAALCILATYRESELGAAHPLADLLADLRREQDVTRVSLSGLDERSVGALVETLSHTRAADALVRQLTASTAGNPFFVGEMLRHLQETGALTQVQDARGSGPAPAALVPEGVREVILRRVARLGDACGKLLTFAAVLGRDFSLDALAVLSELTEDELLDALDEARRAQIVDESPGRPGNYSFHHVLIRDTLYGDLTASRRLRLHQRAAEALERLADRRGDPPLADLAHHFVQAGSSVADKAVDYATRAGDHMIASLASEEALRFYDLALQALETLPPGAALERQRVALQRRRAQGFGNLAQWAPQRAALEEALRRLDGDQIEHRCEILIDFCQCAFWLFDTPSLERASSEALSLAEGIGRQDLAAAAMGWLARGRHQADGNLREVIELDRITIERFGPIARVAHNFGAVALYWTGRAAEGVVVGARAAAMATDSRDATFTMNVLSHYAINLTAVGRYSEAFRVFAQAQEFGRRYGALPLLARANSMSAGVYLSLGDLAGAETIQVEARELARSVNFPPTIVSPGIDLLLIAARRHDPGSAASLFDQTVEASQRTPGWHGWLWEHRLSQVRGELALAREEWEKADAHSTETIALCRRYTRPKYEALALVTRAQARHRVGRTLDAVVDARGAVTIARQTGDPALLLQVLDVLLQLDGTDELALEAKTTIARIRDELPDGPLKRFFVESDLVVRINRL